MATCTSCLRFVDGPATRCAWCDTQVAKGADMEAIRAQAVFDRAEKASEDFYEVRSATRAMQAWAIAAAILYTVVGGALGFQVTRDDNAQLVLSIGGAVVGALVAAHYNRRKVEAITARRINAYIERRTE
jgi:uncharacterized protein YcfJ